MFNHIIFGNLRRSGHSDLHFHAFLEIIIFRKLQNDAVVLIEFIDGAQFSIGFRIIEAEPDIAHFLIFCLVQLVVHAQACVFFVQRCGFHHKDDGMIPYHGKPVSLIIGFIFHPKFRAGRQGIAIQQAGLRKRRERRRTVGIDELQYKGRTLEPGYGFTDFYLGIVWQNAATNSTLGHGTSHAFQRYKLILHGIPVFAGHICHLPNAVLHQRTFVNGILPFKTQLAAVFQNHAVQRGRGIRAVWYRAAGLHRSIGQ